MMPIDTPIFMYHGHSDNVFTVAWSPGGTSIASGSRDKTVRIWNANTGEDSRTYRGHASYLLSVAWCRYGPHLAETWCILTSSNIEYLALHGRLMVSVLPLEALMDQYKPGMLSQGATS